MREIIFKGKRTDNGEWIYGDLMQNVDCVKIREQEKDIKHISKSFEIDPETVGEYIGLTDKNGKKIFEGDIVKCTDTTNDYSFTAVVLFGNPNAEYTWGFQLKRISGANANNHILLWCDMEETGAFIEIIGNIHDNPELLKGGEEE